MRYILIPLMQVDEDVEEDEEREGKRVRFLVFNFISYHLCIKLK